MYKECGKIREKYFTRNIGICYVKNIRRDVQCTTHIHYIF